jgi:hypothetical protein
MLFESLDIHLVAPMDEQHIDGAAASGSIAVRYEGAADGPNLLYLCSGFLISRVHIVTAAHCVAPHLLFDQTYLAGGGDAQHLKIVAFGSTVRLALDGASLPPRRQDTAMPAALGDPLYQNPTLDFAVFALPEPTSSRFVDLTALSTAANHASTDSEELRMYGYPNGVPLSESFHCRSVPALLEDILLHDCDALPGSSGGLLVSTATGLGVAMHLGGTGSNELAYFEKAGHFESPADLQVRVCDPAAEAPDRGPECVEGPGYNKAVKLTSVARDIQQRAPSLWRSILKEST